MIKREIREKRDILGGTRGSQRDKRLKGVGPGRARRKGTEEGRELLRSTTKEGEKRMIKEDDDD